MSTSTAEPLARAAVDKFLSQLTDEQRRYLTLKLFGIVFSPIKERRAIFDELGNFLGDYLPFPKVQPGQKVTMSDEAREALSKTVCKTRSQWEAERVAKNDANAG